MRAIILSLALTGCTVAGAPVFSMQDACLGYLVAASRASALDQAGGFTAKQQTRLVAIQQQAAILCADGYPGSPLAAGAVIALTAEVTALSLKAE